ncbi:MAG: hypothetical protein SPD11_06740 [Sphaerochaetaceae bacterium]|nr:hypothetical protein [Sphaerochaetaceae bacterium]
MAIRKSITRSLYGEKTVLEAFSGEGDPVWIVPRKFSIEEQELINEAARRAMSPEIRNSVARIYLKYKDRQGAMVDQLNDEEIGALLDAQTATSSEVVALILKSGIYEHNLNEGEEPSKVVDDALVKEIMSVQELAMEIVRIVQGFNSPLAGKTSRASGMSRNGSTTGASLKQGTACLTEGNPRK